MDAITDLTARAVSFITLIQDSIINSSVFLKKENEHADIFETLRSFPTEYQHYIDEQVNRSKTDFTTKAIELVWVSSKKPVETEALKYTVKLSTALINWMYEFKGELIKKLKHCGSFPTPFNWREAISEILYSYPAERIRLARALQYLPIQVVLALGGGSYNSRSQRIL